VLRAPRRPRLGVRRNPDGEPEPEAGAGDGDGDGAGLQPVSPPPPVIVPRWVQLVLLPVALLALYELARAAGTVVLVLMVASLVALILNPMVKVLERRHLPRALAIPLSYLAVLAVVLGIGAALAGPVATQVQNFAHEVPHFIKDANRELSSFQGFLSRHGIHVKFVRQGQSALQSLEKDVVKGTGSVVSFSTNLLTKAVGVAIDIVLIFVLSIYFLVYARSVGVLVRRVMPPGDGTPGDDYPLQVQRALSSYVRGQLAFSLIMGASAGLSLAVFGWLGIFPPGSHYAVFFGSFYAIAELIPYIGPIIGAAPPVLVGLFYHPVDALWLVALFVVLQQLEGHLIAPQVFRISLRINPILIILALLLGYAIYGIPGALIALPSATVIRQTVLYLRRHLVLEPWTVRGLPLESPALPERCPECSAPHAPGGRFCPACGAELDPTVPAPG
jgi:predicted PurR-regulated permease PerM